MESDFVKARRIIREEFERDPGLRQVYEDNIAMLLHDRHGITDYAKRNAAAAEVIKLLFGK